MWILRPFAISSIVSIVGDTSPRIMRFIVDLDTPVAIDTWRTDKFFSHIILSNRIFMYYILNAVALKATGNYWYIRFGVYIQF